MRRFGEKYSDGSCKFQDCRDRMWHFGWFWKPTLPLQYYPFEVRDVWVWDYEAGESVVMPPWGCVKPSTNWAINLRGCHHIFVNTPEFGWFLDGNKPDRELPHFHYMMFHRYLSFADCRPSKTTVGQKNDLLFSSVEWSLYYGSPIQAHA